MSHVKQLLSIAVVAPLQIQRAVRYNGGFCQLEMVSDPLMPSVQQMMIILETPNYLWKNELDSL